MRTINLKDGMEESFFLMYKWLFPPVLTIGSVPNEQWFNNCAATSATKQDIHFMMSIIQVPFISENMHKNRNCISENKNKTKTGYNFCFSYPCVKK
jgi:hypothetical protein